METSPSQESKRKRSSCHEFVFTALVKLAKALKLPTVITTSAADSPNGPALPVITQTLSDAPAIHRPGEINAWDNNEFADAVKKTDRKKLIVAGIPTEVCVAFLGALWLEDS